MTVVLDALAARLASATAHNHATEHAPNDGDRKWEPALAARPSASLRSGS